MTLLTAVRLSPRLTHERSSDHRDFGRRVRVTPAPMAANSTQCCHDTAVPCNISHTAIATATARMPPAILARSKLNWSGYAVATLPSRDVVMR
jgi:hypothetical protein